MIEQAMILAAGRGERMRPLTDDRPKPMVEVKGRPIIDYAIDALRDLGIANIVANTHYLPEQLTLHLRRQGVTTEHEPVLLDTGGGIRNALRHFDRTQPLLVLAGDSILAGPHTLRDLAEAWHGDAMDLLLLLQPLETMTITPGVGDYAFDGKTLRRTPDHSGNHMWTSARILHPRLFEDTPEGPFSFLTLMDRAESQGRLAACVNKGIWHHLTTPADVEAVNAA